MIGIVLVTHHHLGDALIEVARMLYGKPEKIISVPLLEGESIEDLQKKVLDALEKIDAKDGALILVDLFGGTPMNALALLAVERNDIEIITGVNVPMLLTVLMEREEEGITVKELAKKALEAGREGIVDVREKLVSKLVQKLRKES